MRRGWTRTEVSHSSCGREWNEGGIWRGWQTKRQEPDHFGLVWWAQEFKLHSYSDTGEALEEIGFWQECEGWIAERSLEESRNLQEGQLFWKKKELVLSAPVETLKFEISRENQVFLSLKFVYTYLTLKVMGNSWTLPRMQTYPTAWFDFPYQCFGLYTGLWHSLECSQLVQVENW